MALPGNITQITVTGKYLDIFGVPIVGKVSFSITPVLIDSAAKVVIIPRTVTAPLDNTGSFTIKLPATNDPDVAPSGYTIQVVEEFEGGGGRSFSITLPEDIPQPVDISTFGTGTPPSGGSITYATQSALNAEITARQNGDNSVIAMTPQYVNAKAYPYYAKGDDATDDTNAIQTALYNCPAGGVVYLPYGKYRTSAPLIVPPHVTLMGSHANGEQLPNDTAPRSCIKPLATFSGDAVIKINDKLTAGYTDESREQHIYDLTIDGSAVPAATLVDGIKVYGYVQSFEMRDVCIWKVTGNGVICLVNGNVTSGSQAPLAMKWQRVIAYEVGKTGFIAFNCTDCTFTDVLALGCNQDGWYLEGPANTTLAECRAEWSSGDGIKIQPKFGPVTLTGCSTDRNDHHGISIIGGDWDSSVLINGARLNRDGRNGGAGGGGYAGLYVESNCPVLVNGILVNARKDDNTTGPLGPAYGISVGNSQELIVNSGYLNAVTAGFNDWGGNSTVLRGPNVEEKIGNMIGTATITKRGMRVDSAGASFFTTTGKEYDLIKAKAWEPEDQGLAAWSVDFGTVIASTQLTSGQIALCAVKLPSPRTINQIVLGVGTAGSGLTAGQNLLGIYNTAGARLGQTGDQSTTWNSTGDKYGTLTASLTLAKGIYWVAILSVGTTPPQILRSTNSATMLNTNLAATASRFGTYGSGLTALPANLTMASIAKGGNAYAVAIL